MNYLEKRLYNAEHGYVRPECVVREESLQVWQDVIKIEEIRKQKLKQQKDAILRANLQFMRNYK